jgi:hypothetical protein
MPYCKLTLERPEAELEELGSAANVGSCAYKPVEQWWYLHVDSDDDFARLNAICRARGLAVEALGEAEFWSSRSRAF